MASIAFHCLFIVLVLSDQKLLHMFGESPPNTKHVFILFSQSHFWSVWFRVVLWHILQSLMWSSPAPPESPLVSLFTLMNALLPRFQTCRQSYLGRSCVVPYFCHFVMMNKICFVALWLGMSLILTGPISSSHNGIVRSQEKPSRVKRRCNSLKKSYIQTMIRITLKI